MVFPKPAMEPKLLPSAVTPVGRNVEDVLMVFVLFIPVDNMDVVQVMSAISSVTVDCFVWLMENHVRLMVTVAQVFAGLMPIAIIISANHWVIPAPARLLAIHIPIATTSTLL